MRSLLVALIVGASSPRARSRSPAAHPRSTAGIPPPGVTAIGFASAPVDATNHDPRRAGSAVRWPRPTKRRGRARSPTRGARPQALGATAGMRLGAVWSVSQDPNLPYYGSGVAQGTFGGNDYCGLDARDGSGRSTARVRRYRQRFLCQAPRTSRSISPSRSRQAG